MPIQTILDWYAHTERPAEPLIAVVAMDCGPGHDPDDFRFSLRSDLFQYRGGRGAGVLVTLEAVEAHAELRVRAARRAAAACQQVAEPAPEAATAGGQS